MTEDARLRQRLLAERLRLIIGQSPQGVAAPALLGAIAVVLLWNSAPRVPLLVTLGCLFATHATWIASYVYFRRHGLRDDEAERWLRHALPRTLVHGMCWGAFSLVAFPEAAAYQSLLVAFMYGLVAGGIVVDGPHLPTFCAFAVPTLLPVVVRCFVEGTPVGIATGTAGLVGLGQALFSARGSSRLNQQAILARFENLALLQELGKQKELAEQARSRAEAASEEKSRFLAAASHDLRQPMHALRLFASAALGTDDEAERRRIVERVDASVASLSALFDALLEVSRLDAGAIQLELHTVSVRELLMALGVELGASAREKGLTLRVRAVDAALRTDPVLLGRILRNLLSNAIAYTERGGVLLTARRRGERLRLEVWDTGVGIPESLQAQVFEEFFQVGNPERDRRKGVGLGLSIVARLAALLGYRVELRSRVDRGSRFSLELPLGTGPASSKPVLTPLDESVLLGALVVAIDDEPDILLALELVLKQSGVLVVTAESGSQALERLNALGRAPDLVISDYRLRGGETGALVVRQLRAVYGEDMPALIVTGDGAADAGELPTLRKPVERDELERALIQLLSG